jgi:hypothetical protein
MINQIAIRCKFALTWAGHLPLRDMKALCVEGISHLLLQ